MKKIILGLMYLSFLVVSCVYPLEFVAGNKKEIMIIEGDINDYDSIQVIKVGKTVPSKNSIARGPVIGARVTVREDGAKEFICEERVPGEYSLPKGFRARVRSKYTLYVKLEAGPEYRSSEEELMPVPEIQKMYAAYAPGGIKFLNSKVDGHIIYLDTKELSGMDDYLFWTWRLFEKQNICATCVGGRYRVEPPYNGQCVAEEELTRLRRRYDYTCETDCWDIFYSDEVRLMSDEFANGAINGNNVAGIPYFNYEGALVEIKQHSLNVNAYRYFKLLAQQSQLAGSLTDTPPAPLIGNVRNINDQYEAVGGYFVVSSITAKNFWLDRKMKIEEKPKLVSQRAGEIIFEPGNPFAVPPRPPLARCVPGKFRTNAEQSGWGGNL